MCFSVAVLNMLAYTATCLLDEDFDVEILDIHHKLKKDAPSGTALMLGLTMAKARNRPFQDVARYDAKSSRKRGEIGFSSQRCGSVCGVHEVSFSGDYERLEIRHEAYSREIFATGALKVAKWLIGKPHGYYTMNNFVGEHLATAIESIQAEFCGV
jgi:4-hydroxy-tetrahydrodipicolinate reductase